MSRATTVHCSEEIERLLKRGLAPITDNLQALERLGFVRAHPVARNQYETSIYERSIDGGTRDSRNGARRVFIRQRAFLQAR